MSSFTLPSLQDSSPSVAVDLPSDISADQLLSFPAFKIWLSTLQRSLSTQNNPKHEFHTSPYVLRKIRVQAVDFFGNGRLGFVKLKAEISNTHGSALPGSVFLRGGSVGILLTLQPHDVPPGMDTEKRVILTLQPRIPSGSLSFLEIPAGMLDDSGTFSGSAAKEIHEETGIEIKEDELIDLTALALGLVSNSSGNTNDARTQEGLQNAMYPSPGGSDEFMPLFLCQKRLERREIQNFEGRLTGLRNEGEMITLKLIPLEDLWKEGARDGKALAAWALYRGLKDQGKI